MCLALLAFNAHPHYAVVIAANRDESHARPTAAAAWWDDGPHGERAVRAAGPSQGANESWLGGRDLRGGGTWLGIARNGRFALLTNVREPSRWDQGAPSRGTLVPQVLADSGTVQEALARVRNGTIQHNGYNLLAGDGREVAWTSNRADDVRSLPPGLYGLSNSLLDVPWPKLVRTRAALATWAEHGDEDHEPLFAALADRALASDPELPSTGVPLEWERLLSAPFIVSAGYGTRSSTVLTIDHNGGAHLVERSFDASGRASGEVEHRFDLDS